MLDTAKYKKLLEEELARLENELKSVGEVNPENPRDWVPTPPDDLELQADPIDRADAIEEYAERVGIEAPLEQQLKSVQKALAAIANNTYGICSVSDLAHPNPHPIEIERLDANPSAPTCVAHME